MVKQGCVGGWVDGCYFVKILIVMAYIDKYGVEFSDDRKTLIYCPEDMQGEYVIPEGTIVISANAFRGCVHLKSIIIPRTVSVLGRKAFLDCDGLEKVCISDLSTWCAADIDSFSSNPLFYAHNLYLNNQLIEHLIIPDEVTKIESNTFQGCECIKHVQLHDKISKIGSNAFEGCSITEITIPQSVTSTGIGAFGNCTKLIHADIRNDKIEMREFAYCKNLRYVNVTEHIKFIDENAFLYCLALCTFKIPDALKNISVKAFSLVPNVMVSARKDVRRPWGARCVNGYIENDLIYANESKNELVACPSYVSGGITIPSKVSSIEKYAFLDCDKITSISLPATINRIADGAFEGCFEMQKIIVPVGLKAKFAQMAALKKYTEIIVEDGAVINQKEWMREYHNFCEKIERARQTVAEGKLTEPKNHHEFLKLPEEYKIAFYYPNGTAAFPPNGMEMPIEVFRDCLSKDSNYRLPMFTWCAAGKDIHDLARGVFGDIGLLIPRKGYYKIIGVEENQEGAITYLAFYNYREPLFAEFESQIVRISKKPFYNKSSVSPTKNCEILIGDIVHVFQQTKLIDRFYNDEPYKTYSVTWKIMK